MSIRITPRIKLETYPDMPDIVYKIMDEESKQLLKHAGYDLDPGRSLISNQSLLRYSILIDAHGWIVEVDGSIVNV